MIMLIFFCETVIVGREGSIKFQGAGRPQPSTVNWNLNVGRGDTKQQLKEAQTQMENLSKSLSELRKAKEDAIRKRRNEDANMKEVNERMQRHEAKIRE